MEQTFGISCYLKKPNPFRKGPWPVYLRVTVDGIRKEISLKRSWEKSKWISRGGKANGTGVEAKALNMYLDVMRSKVYAARLMMIEKDQPISSVAIIEIISGVAQRKKMLLNIYNEFNRDIEKLIGKEYSKDTWERYVRVCGYTREFVKLKYSSEDINIHLLNLEFVKTFYNFLRNEKKCAHNTTIKYIGLLKAVVLFCVDNGWLVNNPFARFDMTLNEVDTVYLTKEELEKIANKNITNERLSTTRDIFMFCCFTSLAYIDVKQLKKSEVKIGVDGNLWIDKRRQKSKVPTKVPLLPITKQILEKYSNDKRCQENDLLLPVISNAKYNEYLKEIASICGISKNLTTHTARHTFGTTVTMSNGVPVESIKQMMGHKKIEQTLHYAQILPTKVSDDMLELESKMEQKMFLKEYTGQLSINTPK